MFTLIALGLIALALFYVVPVLFELIAWILQVFLTFGLGFVIVLLALICFKLYM